MLNFPAVTSCTLMKISVCLISGGGPWGSEISIILYTSRGMPMKWIDRASATEMDKRPSATEMDEINHHILVAVPKIL